MVLVPLVPWTSERLEGLALIEKSFAGVTAPQPESLNEPTCVSQLKVPFDGMYSVVYQNVQSSEGSMVRFE